MNRISITTTQNVELEYDLATEGERLLAWLVDFSCFLVLFFVITLLLGTLGALPQDGVPGHSGLGWLLLILFVLPFVFYNLVCEILLNGQTVGKKLLRLRIISMDGQPPQFGQFLIRWLFRLVDIYLFSGLPALISILATKKNQRIGDLVAGTVVIRTQSRAALHQTFYVPQINPQYTVSFPEVAILADRDAQLVNEVINRVGQTGDSTLAYRASEKIKEYLHIQTTLEPMAFLQAVLADFNYLSARG